MQALRRSRGHCSKIASRQQESCWRARETEPAPRPDRRLYLVRNGVPFDVAFSLPPDERMAFVVAFGTLDGRVFNWQSLRWNSRA